jgi:asparagine synthase (glutamine-hydrolysing)
MSAQAGVFYFDMRPTHDCCRDVTSGLRLVSADNVSVVREAGVVLGRAGPCAWSDDVAPQPGRSATGFVSTWDGRLDNRDDLALQLSGRMSSGIGDHALALSAFERWGLDAFRVLVGEWSMVIWSARDRILHLARDYMGVRPLYYCVSERSVMWSTSLGELAKRSGRVDALSHRFVSGFLSQQFSSDLTPYRGIRGVPPGGTVTFAADADSRVRCRQFWTLRSGTVRYRDRREYEEHLRALWREAVASALRTSSPVWAELSGGFDSSSVVCMADALMRSGCTPARHLRLASHATLHSPEGDERRFIAEVERQVGVSAVILGVEDHQDLVDRRWGWVTPCAARGVGLARVQHIQKAGGRVVLSGRGGDAVMGCEPDNSVAVLDDWAEGKVGQALRKARLWSRSCRKPFIEIAWCAAREWLVRCSDIHPSKRRLAELLMSFATEARLNLPQQPPGLIFTYPFFYRPLVDYVMSIPGEELSAPGNMRSLMRRAFAGFVPATILRRTSKGYYPPSSARATRSGAVTLRPVERLEVVQRGWVDPKRLERAIVSVVDGGGQDSADVRRVLRLEEWLRLRQRRDASAIPQREEVNNDEVLNA